LLLVELLSQNIKFGFVHRQQNSVAKAKTAVLEINVKLNQELLKNSRENSEYILINLTYILK